jgi:hypothetical protein
MVAAMPVTMTKNNWVFCLLLIECVASYDLGHEPVDELCCHWELLCTYLYTYEVPVRGVQTEVVTKRENVINPGFANFLKCIIERSI